MWCSDRGYYFKENTTMREFQDLTGQKFGRLTVIKRDKNDNRGQTRWLCQCQCGNLKIVRANHLKSGKIKSCGCYNIEILKKRSKTHGLIKTRIYSIWNRMKQRCTNPNNSAYKNYGGRGITICQEWIDDFLNFYNWAIANGYRDDLSIDRINNNKGYYPENCKWATKKQQARNRRNNHLITYNGETHCISEWAEIFNINEKLLAERLRTGYKFETAIKNKNIKKIHKIRCIETNTIYESAKEIEQKFKISRNSIYFNCRKVAKSAGGYHWEYVD